MPYLQYISTMQQDSRDSLFSALTKVSFSCQQHPEEIANMITTNQLTDMRTLICSNCLALIPAKAKQIQPLKMALFQIHQTCKTLLSDISASAFVDHHMNLIRGIVKHHFKQNETLLLCSVNNCFLKYRELLTGKYFTEFYAASTQIIESLKNNSNFQGNTTLKFKRTKKLMNFIHNFYKLVTSFEDYYKMTMEEVMSGQNLVKQIKAQVGEMYKQIKEKAQNVKHYTHEQILQLFNPSLQAVKAFRFSSTLLNSSLKLIDAKTITTPNLPDNQYTLMALIEPCICNKKRSIKLKMKGIKGWVAAGIAIRSKVEANAFKFEQPSHGTFQISYDGYSWSQDTSVNEQYTSWYFNQNDTLMMTVTPSSGELVFMKNEEQNNTYTLKFKSQKKDKLYFCVSLNYFQDSVAIVQ